MRHTTRGALVDAFTWMVACAQHIATRCVFDTMASMRLCWMCAPHMSPYSSAHLSFVQFHDELLHLPDPHCQQLCLLYVHVSRHMHRRRVATSPFHTTLLCGCLSSSGCVVSVFVCGRIIRCAGTTLCLCYPQLIQFRCTIHEWPFCKRA